MEYCCNRCGVYFQATTFESIKCPKCANDNKERRMDERKCDNCGARKCTWQIAGPCGDWQPREQPADMVEDCERCPQTQVDKCKKGLLDSEAECPLKPKEQLAGGLCETCATVTCCNKVLHGKALVKKCAAYVKPKELPADTWQNNNGESGKVVQPAVKSHADILEPLLKAARDKPAWEKRTTISLKQLISEGDDKLKRIIGKVLMRINWHLTDYDDSLNWDSIKDIFDDAEILYLRSKGYAVEDGTAEKVAELEKKIGHCEMMKKSWDNSIADFKQQIDALKNGVEK